jgi:hypothetical protein
MSILYNKKAKCQGCLALVSRTDGNGAAMMLCKLGYSIDFTVMNNVAVRPKPNEKCYKPIDAQDYERAKELSANKVEPPEEKNEPKPMRSKHDYMTPLEAKYYS